MNLNKENFKDFPENCPGFYFHDYTINKITINNKENKFTIEGQEISKPEFITTLIFNNVLYFEYPNFNPWGSSDGIISCIFGLDLNSYIDHMMIDRYFDFEKENITLKENKVFSNFDRHLIIIIEMLSGDYLKVVVTDVDIFETEVK